LGDDRLVLGHRLSEWCGHGPVLEEDIALANVALDLIGQATHFLQLAGQVEGKGRDEDALAYFRDAIDYRNVNLVELPNGDFGRTIVRQFLFDAWSVLLLDPLQRAADTKLAGIAAKAYKEARYHVRHSGEWVLRLGDGTEESHRRVQTALDELWPYTGELFAVDEVDRLLAGAGAPEPAALEPAWREVVSDVVRRATLTLPSDGYMHSGGRQGRHTEHLGHLLAEMQILARSHTGAKW
jgi:ring-1,2-phenylacetyl-CoA epoxidase subunit PaaC